MYVDEQKALLDAGMEVNRLFSAIPASEPFKNVYMGMITPNRPPEVESFLAMRSQQMEDSNAIARAFRKNTRATEFPRLGELRKSGMAPLAKANLDVGTLTNFAQITGGQSLGYVSLDVQMARGTVRPGSFTLYQALHKTRAFQVVDYWSYASDTGGGLPGSAFQGYAAAGAGTMNTQAGKYFLQNITLKLATNGRAITTALAAQNSFVDVAAQENINAALTVLESLNWASYWGQPSIYPNQFLGAYQQINAYNPLTSGANAVGSNVIDFQAWNNSYAAGQGWSPQQALFNLIYQWAAQITSYNKFGRITHAFMSPTCAGSLQGLTTTILNNIVTGFPSNAQPAPILVNGDLQGIRTRFGEIQFPVDLYITARDIPAQGIKNGDGTNNATTVAPSPPATVTVTASGAAAAGSMWTATYVAASGQYTYAVAAVDANMNESTLTWGAPVNGILAGRAYTVAISGNATVDYVGFRIYRSGLGENMTSPNTNPAALRYIGTVAATGQNATFSDINTKIPGGETLFLFDLDEQDNAIDYRYLLPLTKIELFAQNLYMPWAVACIGGLRVRVPKFHGIINNYVGDNPEFNPLSTNTGSNI